MACVQHAVHFMVPSPMGGYKKNSISGTAYASVDSTLGVSSGDRTVVRICGASHRKLLQVERVVSNGQRF